MSVNWKTLAGAILLCELAGVVGSVFTVENIPTWYAALTKPAWTPPNWVFGPVWTALYALMGVALYLVVTKQNSGAKKAAIGFFAVQLVLNVLWSIAFFGFKSPLAGIITIILLDASIIATIIQYNKVDRNAALLMLPYLAWCLFATALNATVWLMN